MAEDAATIEMAKGDPGAVSDAGVSLGRVAGAFDRMAGGVGRAVAAAGSWEGYASVSFQGRAAGYGQAAGSVDGVLARARGALARYAERLDDARERIKRLQREEEDCVERLRLEKRRLEDALGRASEARTRLSNATFTVGLDATPFSMAEQARAVDQIEAAEADAQQAERAIAREREELKRLRDEAKQEREALEDAEFAAAAAVRAAAGDLPDVRLANGAVAPSALAGTPFGPGLMSPAQRDLLAAGRAADGEDDGNALDGLGKAWGDVKDEVGGLAEGAFNHVNVTDPDKLGDTWTNDWDTAKNIAGDPLGAAAAAINGTIEPLKDSYEKGGLDEAIGRSPSVIAGVLGGKGLTKLDDLGKDKPGDSDSGDDGSSPPDPSGPGSHVPKNEHMSDYSRRYQEFNGARPGETYRVEGPKGPVDFDGHENGTLIESKGRYDQFFEPSGKPKPFYDPETDLLDQARRQAEAAGGRPVEWRFAERGPAYEWARKEFKREELPIRVRHVPMPD